MNQIEYIETHTVYANPRPHVHSRHAFFPGVIQLPSGELLAMFARGEAFESPDLTTYASRSSDRGRTWELQGPLYDKRVDPFPMSDFMKPALLRDGTVLALGYRFHRHDPEDPIGIEKTEGVLPGDNVISRSIDAGRTWEVPRIIPRSIPELLEIPSRGLQLRSGDVVATAGLFTMPDGTNPSGQFGVFLRSRDNGQTWDDTGRFLQTPAGTVAAWESHVCEMQDGRLVTICWARDVPARRDLPNQVTVSHDDGHSWSSPIDTGHMGQAANLLWLGGDKLMSIHCHRGQEVGLYVRIVDFSHDRWKVLDEKLIWGASVGRQARDGQKFHDLAKSLRFGQASLLRLDSGEILATHWAIEDCIGKILSHRLRIPE